MGDELAREFENEFHDAWNRHRVKPKQFQRRKDFSTARRVNIIAINGENVTIDEMNEGGEIVRSTVPLSSLSNFRR